MQSEEEEGGSREENCVYKRDGEKLRKRRYAENT